MRQTFTSTTSGNVTPLYAARAAIATYCGDSAVYIAEHDPHARDHIDVYAVRAYDSARIVGLVTVRTLTDGGTEATAMACLPPGIH